MIARKINPDELLTSQEVGELLQVNRTSVNNWIGDGRITAHRTPGGHRRIRAGDLVEFLELHSMPVPGELSGAQRRRLLLVDDDLTHLRALQRILKPYRTQLEVQQATNGIDALVQVGSFKPHLIVLDVFMPEVDGIEVCRRLKANPETRHIGVIITTGQLTTKVRDAALGAGARQCLSKPLNLAALLEDLGMPQLRKGA